VLVNPTVCCAQTEGAMNISPKANPAVLRMVDVPFQEGPSLPNDPPNGPVPMGSMKWARVC
jgi:hypothetical protein